MASAGKVSTGHEPVPNSPAPPHGGLLITDSAVVQCCLKNTYILCVMRAFVGAFEKRLLKRYCIVLKNAKHHYPFR